MLDLLLAAVLTAGGYGDGRLLCTLTEPSITESSGLAASVVDDDLLYTHNDSGDVARVFQLDRTCRLRATLVLRGQDARDWEDMSRGPGNTLWLGDIGDNSAIRDRGILVHRVRDPGPKTGVVQVPWTSYRLTYADGPKDAEALLVHPRTGQLLIVSKGFAGGGIYAAPLHLRPDRPNVLQRVGEVQIPEVTSGDISPDGRRVVLRNYSAAYEWDVEGDDVVAAMRGAPTRIPLPRSPQGEAITYARDGRALLTSSEGIGAPIHELRRGKRATASASAPAVAPAAKRVRSIAPWVVAVLGALLLLSAGLLGLRRTRSTRSR